MENYILAESFGRSNIQHRLWYAMSSSDLNDIKAQFGDRAYVITDGAYYYMGNDNSWYDSNGDAIAESEI